MYKRDFAAVLLSCIAILVSLQNEGTFTFRKAWCVEGERKARCTKALSQCHQRRSGSEAPPALIGGVQYGTSSSLPPLAAWCLFPLLRRYHTASRDVDDPLDEPHKLPLPLVVRHRGRL